MNEATECKAKSTGLSGEIKADGDRIPLPNWITEERIAYTQEVWSEHLERDVDRDEAIEMLMNVRNLADVLFRIQKENEKK